MQCGPSASWPVVLVPMGAPVNTVDVSASNELIVNTGVIIQGPAIGTNTTGQEAEGPNCISVGGGH